MRIITLFALLVFCCPAATAGSYLTFGHGNTTCGAYLEEREKEEVTLEHVYASSWLHGYLTRFSRDNRVDSISSDIPSMLQWIENYCRDNPLRNFAYAAAILTVHLQDNDLVIYSEPDSTD